MPVRQTLFCEAQRNLSQYRKPAILTVRTLTVYIEWIYSAVYISTWTGCGWWKEKRTRVDVADKVRLSHLDFELEPRHIRNLFLRTKRHVVGWSGLSSRKTLARGGNGPSVPSLNSSKPILGDGCLSASAACSTSNKLNHRPPAHAHVSYASLPRSMSHDSEGRVRFRLRFPATSLGVRSFLQSASTGRPSLIPHSWICVSTSSLHAGPSRSHVPWTRRLSCPRIIDTSPGTLPFTPWDYCESGCPHFPVRTRRERPAVFGSHKSRTLVVRAREHRHESRSSTGSRADFDI